MGKTMRHLFFSFIDFLISIQFIIALSALGLSVETNVLFNLPLNSGADLAFIFFGSLSIYNLAFLGRQPLKMETLQKNKLKSVICLFSLLCCIVLLFFLPPVIFFLAFLSGISGFFYLYELKWKNRTIQIRNIPLLKNILLSTIWSIVTVLIPWAAYHKGFSFSRYEIIIFLRRFFFILAIAIPYDIRDYPEDLKKKLHTLPVAVGETKTKIIALLSLLCFAILVLYNALVPEYAMRCSNRISSAFFISILLTAIVIMMVNASRSKYFYYVLLDGTMILQFFLVLVALKSCDFI
jgi:4-hydroxybenzoate polyprenyltransferase